MADQFDKKPSKNTSEVSVYPIFKMKGDVIMSISKGTAFSDPGVDVSEVIEGGTDLNATMTIRGKVDATTPGLYFLTYVAKNKYNYIDSVKRTVLVYEGDLSLNPNIAGNYKGTITMGDMVVTASSIPGFWNTTNVNSKTVVIPATLADIGGGKYVLVPGTYTDATGIGAYKGTAKLIVPATGNNQLEVSLTLANGTFVKLWKKQ